MKKNSPTRLRWLFIRARNEFRRRHRQAYEKAIRIWQGEDVEFAISERAPTYPPTIMCLERNTVEVTGFLERLRRRLLRNTVNPAWTTRRSAGKKLRIKGYLDFSTIEEISTSAALVLAAEYERVVSLVGSPPPLINLDEWNFDVFGRLLQLGFFTSVGITPKIPEQLVTSNQDVMTLHFLSGSNAEETEAANKMLMELGNFLDPDHELPEEITVPLTGALSEAMINVRRHAYPSNHRFAHKHINRWWLTGSADRKGRKLTVVIYDQGATIPITYSKLSSATHIREWISKQVSGQPQSPFAMDGLHIAAAAKFGNSQTEKSYRGKGLPDMQNAIDQCENGRLMILSRGGRYVYEGPNKSEVSSFPSSIGGTLIEWTLNLPSGNGPKVHHDIG